MSDEKGLILDCIFFKVPTLNILQGAYLEVKPGQICGLFGLNGSGKTTLLKIAAGQLKPDGGIVILDGERIYKPAIRKRFERLAWLPQDSMLPGDMKVRLLIELVATDSDALKTDDVLSDHLDQRIEQLSGGERRYLELSIVLSFGRPYVILDEPFTGIEPILIDRMTDRIRGAVNRGAGILITDQYRHYLLPIVDSAYLMDSKQCRFLGAGQEIEQNLIRYGYLPDSPNEPGGKSNGPPGPSTP